MQKSTELRDAISTIMAYARNAPSSNLRENEGDIKVVLTKYCDNDSVELSIRKHRTFAISRSQQITTEKHGKAFLRGR